jgi:hypothetical protein
MDNQPAAAFFPGADTAPPQPAAPARPPAYPVTPAEGSRLDQLLNQRAAAKMELDAARERFASIDSAIKGDLTAAVPEGTEAIDIAGTAHRKPVRLFWKRENRFDVRQFKADNPTVYENYRRPSGHWEIRELESGTH